MTAARTGTPPAGADRVALWLATWFGCGLIPKAPGTWGTIGALPLYFLAARAGWVGVLVAALASTLVGIWASERVVRHLGAKDPQIICIDEVAGVLITLIPAPHNPVAIVTAVVLFRLLDVWKPWPARLAERRLAGGLGVVLDDVLAGAWGAVAIAAGHRLGLF